MPETIGPNGLLWDTPGYMNAVSKSVHMIRPRKTSDEYLSLHKGDVPGGHIMVAPPCFNLRSKFAIHEQVLILPDKNVVKHLLKIPHLSPKNKIAYTFLNYALGTVPLFALATKFRIVGIIYAEDPKDPNAYWTTYKLAHPKVPDFELPASMICREIELLPFTI